jgi:hypothetical protein
LETSVENPPGGFWARKKKLCGSQTSLEFPGGSLMEGIVSATTAQHSNALECCGREATWFPEGKPTLCVHWLRKPIPGALEPGND